MKNEMNYTPSELEDLRVVSRETMDAEIEFAREIAREVAAEREHARIARAAANGLSWSKLASIRPIRK